MHASTRVCTLDFATALKLPNKYKLDFATALKLPNKYKLDYATALKLPKPSSYPTNTLDFATALKLPTNTLGGVVKIQNDYEGLKAACV